MRRPIDRAEHSWMTTRFHVGASSMGKVKDVFTTGQVARICKVAPRTVSKWFDAGQLRGYRIPGSKDRRIPREHLVSFMRMHGIPLNGMEPNNTCLLVLDPDPEVTQLLRETLGANGRFDIRYAKTAFEAGVAVESGKPAVLIVDVSLPDVDPQQLCRDLRASEDLHALKLIAISAAMTEGQGQSMLQAGFDGYLQKPFEVAKLAEVVERVLATHL